MSRIINPTLGSDPEVFVYDMYAADIISAIGLIGGEKDAPRPVEKHPGFFVQEDNVLAEFNVPPTSTKTGFISVIEEGLKIVNDLLPPTCAVRIAASHSFNPEYLSSRKAIEFGCDPDFCAWTQQKNPTPVNTENPLLRSAGGHVIVGYKDSHEPTNVLLIKMMDRFLGVPSVILDPDMERRKLYGKAGSFRHKPFGVEYRTLSSFWLADKRLIGWVWDQTMAAIDAVNNAKVEYLRDKDLIVDIINNGDVDAAKIFVEEQGIQMP